MCFVSGLLTVSGAGMLQEFCKALQLRQQTYELFGDDMMFRFACDQHFLDICDNNQSHLSRITMDLSGDEVSGSTPTWCRCEFCLAIFPGERLPPDGLQQEVATRYQALHLVSFYE
jgi:hypothetical protein